MERQPLQNEEVPDQSLVGVTCDTYCDLHRKRSSLKALKGTEKGRVVGKPRCVVLRDVTFRVLPGGLARARKENERNVHAYARGTIVGGDVSSVSSSPNAVRIRYNPFVHDFFFVAETEAPVRHAAMYAIEGKTHWAIGAT